ncbi:hypothetical protein DB346_12750 [Verrucomicrobia bacterium LW23]|nr:hypothetical protein DB346_12750 [Verrucomicrobia bacterium LW23]
MPASPDEAVLETFPNPSPARDYTISFATEEFTSVCPVTGQPDFARITLEYVPDVLCVESKSLKFYLASFRNERAFNESVTNRILDDFVRVIQPRKANIRGAFAARGGIALTVTAEYIKPPVVPAPATVATGASTPRRATGPVPLGPGAAAPAEVPSHRPLIRRPAQPSRPIEQGGGRSETETRVL